MKHEKSTISKFALILVLIFNFIVMNAQSFFVEEKYRVKEKGFNPNYTVAEDYLKLSIEAYKEGENVYEWQLYSILRDFIRLNHDIEPYYSIIDNPDSEQLTNFLLSGYASTSKDPPTTLLKMLNLNKGNVDYFKRLIREEKDEEAIAFLEQRISKNPEGKINRMLNVICENAYNRELINALFEKYNLEADSWIKLPIKKLIENNEMSLIEAKEIINNAYLEKVPQFNIDKFKNQLVYGLLALSDLTNSLKVLESIETEWIQTSTIKIIEDDYYQEFPDAQKNEFEEYICGSSKLSSSFLCEFIKYKGRRSENLDEKFIQFLRQHDDKLADHKMFLHFHKAEKPFLALQITDSIPSENNKIQLEYALSQLLKMGYEQEALTRLALIPVSQMKDDVTVQLCRAYLEKEEPYKVIQYLQTNFHNKHTTKQFIIFILGSYYGKKDDKSNFNNYLQQLEKPSDKVNLCHVTARYHMGIIQNE